MRGRHAEDAFDKGLSDRTLNALEEEHLRRLDQGSFLDPLCLHVSTHLEQGIRVCDDCGDMWYEELLGPDPAPSEEDIAEAARWHEEERRRQHYAAFMRTDR
jgi:hypothetical protein